MPSTWTAESVLALAPDPASASAGRGLASPSKWVSLGSDATSLWGEAKGSGAKPYQVAIDLSEPAFKCSCPSRKFPCKHALGLFLMYAQNACPAGEPPAFLREWLEKRQAKTSTPKETKAPDPAAQAKRAEQRRDRVRAGLEDCALWLRDTIRQGLASPAVGNEKHFEGLAARMVDAQAPGVARRLREMGELLHSGPGWQERVVEKLAHLHLIVEAYARIESLPADVQEDVLAAVGFTQKREELPEPLRVADTWSVVGQIRYQEDRLSVQRSWLWGRASARWAMVLAFSVANAPFDPLLSPGTAFQGRLAFYPGAEGLRALPIDRHDVPLSLPTGLAVDEALDRFADQLARCPWTEAAPILIAEARLAGPEWCVVDSKGERLPLVDGFEPWRWLAITGGEPASIFGEWDGHRFRPLSGIYQGRWFGL